MSDTWVDPRSDPFFQGLPTQQDYYANEYGQGFGNSGFDSPNDEVDDRMERMREYFKMTGTYLPDRIPGIPDIVEKPDTSKLVISPMPGLVVSMDVAVGQEVQAGEAVCVVEAMKMQNIIRAEATGTVKAINVEAGASVAADEIMVEFA